MPTPKELLEGRFMNHPLHPIVVHLPVGLWIGSLIFDVAYFATHNSAFSETSYFCILLGLITAIVAMPLGFVDYLEIPSNTVPKRIAATHMVLNVGIFILYIINFFSRRAVNLSSPVLVTGGQFLLSLVSVGFLGISGYLGGLLVYDHGIGFKPQRRDKENHPIKHVA